MAVCSVMMSAIFRMMTARAAPVVWPQANHNDGKKKKKKKEKKKVKKKYLDRELCSKLHKY